MALWTRCKKCGKLVLEPHNCKEKKKQTKHSNKAKGILRGIPEFSLAEKITEVIPVKVQASLKEAVETVCDVSVSEFCRNAIIEKLERLREKLFERELEGSG